MFRPGDMQTLAAELAKRPRHDITITLKDGRQIAGVYDPLFRTITAAGATFPEREREKWILAFCGSELASIDKGGEL
jgi:hypothetical protein